MTEERCSATVNPESGKKRHCQYMANKLEENGIESPRTPGRYKFRCTVCNLLSKDYCFMRCKYCQEWVNTNNKKGHRCVDQQAPVVLVSPTVSSSSNTNAHLLPQVLQPSATPPPLDFTNMSIDNPLPQVTFDDDDQQILDMLTDENVFGDDDAVAIIDDAFENTTVVMPPQERQQCDDDNMLISPWLVRDRFFWKDLGVRLELCFQLNKEIKADLLNALRPYYDYVRVEMPRFDWIVHEFYHCPLQEIAVDENDLLTLSFLPFNPNEIFFRQILDLKVEEITGTAHFVLTSGQNHTLIKHLQAKVNITFYRHLEAEDQQRLLAVVANITGQMAAYYRNNSSSSSNDFSASSSKKRRHSDTTYNDSSNTSYFAACLRNERALVKLVRTFIASAQPSHEILLRLEDMATEASCFYLLHVLVDMRIGSIVRSTIGVCTNDHVSDTVLDFLGCDYSAAKAWAVHRIQSAYRDSATKTASSPEIKDRRRRSTEPAATIAAKVDSMTINEQVLSTTIIPARSRHQVPRRRLTVANPSLHRVLSVEGKDRHMNNVKLAICRQHSQRKSFLGESTSVELSAIDLNQKYGPYAERRVREWIEKITGRQFTRPFMQELSDGKMLCDLVQKIKRDIFDDVVAPLENPQARIDTFLFVLQDRFGFGPEFLFDPQVDLHNESNSAAVVHCIYELALRTKQLRSDLPELEEVSINNKILPVVVVDDDDDQPQRRAQSWPKRFMKELFTTSKKSSEEKVLPPTRRLKLQNTNISVISVKSDEEEPEPEYLTVWTISNHCYMADEKKLCSILSAKGKRFELVYVDVTPERKLFLDTICSNPQLPVLTAGADYIGSCKDIVRLEAKKKLDERICLAPFGKGYWLMSHPDWQIIENSTT
uniref:Calponin-homology (CH) domain-containing protein n=1 Tax=Aureoumbra lagunensis TaxID=44058 RepID=A0A7S3NGB5_9STRA|mmetsp:Transcript_10390/g.15682  ORF Transcript_10390/g.15682 Transcript_10390/m.15682 type:complete len:882 (-) Transcript_10390:413-3058(-)